MGLVRGKLRAATTPALCMLLLALAACSTQSSAWTGLGARGDQAHNFFSGQKLEIAQAMDADDMAEVKRLAAGEDLSAKGKKGMTLMAYAMLPGTSSYPNYAAMQTLVSLGLDPELEVIEGLGSCLHLVLSRNSNLQPAESVGFLRAMLAGGMSVEKPSKPSARTLLMRAAATGSPAQLEVLLAQGAKIDARDSLGRTAFNEAVLANRPDNAILLLQHGADIQQANRAGSVPMRGVQQALERMHANPLRDEFENLRDLMVAKGAAWPPPDPAEVREAMRARGQTPIVPAGQTR